MEEGARQRRYPLPVGIDRATRVPMTLERAVAEPGTLLTGADLTDAERVELVRARWGAGGWENLFVCDERVDLARALRELDAGSDLGRNLQRITERAIEIALQAAREEGEL